MKKVLVFGFFIFTLLAGMDHSISYANDNLTSLQKADSIFNWLESMYPQILASPPQPTFEVGDIYYRWYPRPNVAIGTTGGDLYFLDQAGTLYNLGAIDTWLPYAQEGDGGDLIGFGPIKIGETWVEYRYNDDDYVGMCHTFISQHEVEFKYEDMVNSVTVSYDFNGKRLNYEPRKFYVGGDEIWFRTQGDGTGQRGDQMAVYLGQTNSNQIEVHRVWYYPDGRISDEDKPDALMNPVREFKRYWKRMSCPH